MAEPIQPDPGETERIPDPIYESVEVVAAVYERVEQALPRQQRGIESLVAKLGRPSFLYGYVVFAILWIAGNLLARGFGLTPFDAPPFFWLQGSVTMGSLLTTIVVLITQNRQGSLIEQRAHLDLQVNLLAERKIAKIIALLEEMRRDNPMLKNRYDSVAEAMQQPADPERVVELLEAQIDLKR